MIKFKDYNWFLEGLAALVLLVSFVLMLIYDTEVALISIRLTGLGILFFTIIRVKPIIASRNEKDFLLLLFVEFMIDLIVGIVMLFSPEYLTKKDNEIFNFARLIGAVLFVRGVTHFYTTAKRYELHDIFSFVFHIIAISFGFLYLWNGNLTIEKIVLALEVIAIILSIYFGYRSYRGYNNYRIQKSNLLKMEDYLHKPQEKPEVKIEDPLHIDEKINPKIVDEPEEDKRPSIDIN